MRGGLAFVLAVAAVMVPRPARPHGMRTAYLELVEGEGDGILASWRMTIPDPSLRPRFPSACEIGGEVERAATNARSFSLRCRGGLAGATLAVDGLGPVLTEAVVRVVRRDGSVLSRILTRDAPRWTVPVAGTWAGVAVQYVRLGVEHILTGVDHLLFLLALVLYVRRPRAVLLTETAFTVSHSVSFSATALGLIHASAPAAEACIALSLVLVALEAGAPARAADPRWQGPAIALVFGLVHGLGFAGGLSAVGLPDRAVATALVAFGAGVELGQVAFLVLVMLALAALARTAWAPRVATAGAYVVGVTGAWWLFQRLWVCLG